MPSSFGKFAEQFFELRSERRRSHGPGQNAQAGALIYPLGLELAVDRGEKTVPRTNAPGIG